MLRAWRRRRRHIALINSDVKARLLELLLHVNLAGELQWEQPGSDPADFMAGHGALGDINRRARHVRADDIALSGGGVAIGEDQLFLVFDRTDSGADHHRRVKTRGVSPGEVREETSRPWTTIAAIFRKVSVDQESPGRGHRNQQMLGNAIVEVLVVEDALQSFGLVYLILARERFKGPAERSGHGGEPHATEGNCFSGGIWSKGRLGTFDCG
jgi:hypothetical protein